MFDDTKQSDDELFDKEESSETEDQADDGDDTQEDVVDDILEGESKPDKSDKLTAGQIERQKQIDVWTRRVASGETSLDDMPKNLNWLKPHIQNNLKALAKEPEIEELVEKKFAEATDKKLFSDLKGKLNDSDLTAAEKKNVSATYKRLRAKGLLAGESLELAMAPMQLSLERNVQKKKDMKNPKPGYDVREDDTDKEGDIETEAFWKKRPEDRIKTLAKLIK